ncbi:hypothetical protein G4B88_015314 [Cannabis sativa]|uniref:Uncharacterized protein n=1 Tax=Cannabis sativa TaxID=3483 RepID=A0A7J6EFM2_CANSA|nr:hypothetical protein G4B88_015314 [Cannabis sativa]
MADLREDEQFLRDYPGAHTISTQQGEDLKKQIGAMAYLECSSKTQQNVKGVFDAAIKLALHPPKSKKHKSNRKGCNVDSRHQHEPRKQYNPTRRNISLNTMCAIRYYK